MLAPSCLFHVCNNGLLSNWKCFCTHTYRMAHALQIVVNGKELPRTTELWYFAANKPKGYLCANAPGKDGTTKLVVDLFEVNNYNRATCRPGDQITRCWESLHCCSALTCCNRTGGRLCGRGNIRIQGLFPRGSSLLDALMWPQLASSLSPTMVCTALANRIACTPCVSALSNEDR